MTPVPWRKAEARESGVSLLEVVIVMGLLTSLALGTTLLMVPIARQSRINRETGIADAAAQRVLEQFHATPFNDIVDAYPQASEGTILDLPDGRWVVNYADPTTDPLEIQLAVSWTSPELGDMQLVFDTVRTE